MLSGIPQLRAIFEVAEATLADLDHYVALCEGELSDCLRSERIPPAELVEAIATAKVRCVECCIDLSFRLKQEVGSFALMGDAGFAHLDFLQCCKFAEGDSRILMQKMARDRLKRFQKAGGAAGPDADAETQLCAGIGQAMQAAWDASWKEVYELAELVMARTQADYVAGAAGR